LLSLFSNLGPSGPRGMTAWRLRFPCLPCLSCPNRSGQHPSWGGAELSGFKFLPRVSVISWLCGPVCFFWGDRPSELLAGRPRLSFEKMPSISELSEPGPQTQHVEPLESMKLHPLCFFFLVEHCAKWPSTWTCCSCSPARARQRHDLRHLWFQFLFSQLGSPSGYFADLQGRHLA
jgi:hypothetical protein